MHLKPTGADIGVVVGLLALDELQWYIQEVSHCGREQFHFNYSDLTFWQDKLCQTSFPMLAPLALEVAGCSACILGLHWACLFCLWEYVHRQVQQNECKSGDTRFYEN